MVGRGDMEFTVELCGHSYVRTILPDALITESPEGFDQLGT
jgi:hypothetical protein